MLVLVGGVDDAVVPGAELEEPVQLPGEHLPAFRFKILGEPADFVYQALGDRLVHLTEVADGVG